MILLTPHLCVANFFDSMDDFSDQFALQLYAYNWNGTKFELPLGGTWFFLSFISDKEKCVSKFCHVRAFII